MNRMKLKLLIDILMFLDLLVVAVSGFVIWFVYPTNSGSGRAGALFLLTRFQWLGIHNWVAVVFVILLLVHLFLNFPWIKSRFRKKEVVNYNNI